MSYLADAIEIICTYEGFHPRAYPDPDTGHEPYTLGFGTQFYPDGSPVKQGHCCTEEKALEYLNYEIHCIEDDLNDLDLYIDNSMRAALISFIHSIGWKPFLYSQIIECIEQENWAGVIDQMYLWIFNKDHLVIGGLLERRRDETKLFSRHICKNEYLSGHILLNAIERYAGSSTQIKALKKLEARMNPYILAEFSNNFYRQQNFD